MIVADILEDVEQKRDYYLQLMAKAKQLNDQKLVKLILKKMIHLGMTRAVSTSSGCVVIPFPLIDNTTEFTKDEELTWWVLLKLTIAIPGSFAALILMACYSM